MPRRGKTCLRAGIECESSRGAELGRSHANVALYLVNGIRLRGSLIAFDNHTVLLSDGTSKQLVYKSAISTLVVDNPDARDPVGSGSRDDQEPPRWAQRPR